MIKIKKKTFSGTSKVFSGELAQAIRGVAQYQAAAKLDTAAVTALTNSAGGTANGTINAIGNVTPAVLGTTDCAQKAGFETALVTVKDAISRDRRQAQRHPRRCPGLPGAHQLDRRRNR